MPDLNKAKDKVSAVVGKASAKAKSISCENKLQKAYADLGKAVYQNQFANAREEVPDEYVEPIREIDELLTEIDVQDDIINALDHKTRCISCGTYSDSDACYCYACGAKKVTPKSFEDVEEAGEGCECGSDEETQEDVIDGEADE